MSSDGHWKKWFAWHPVKADGSWVWLKLIYRMQTEEYVGPYVAHDYYYSRCGDYSSCKRRSKMLSAKDGR